MGEHTAISWCDHTWNPWIGCTKVSPACDGCYAENMMDKRHGRVTWGGPGKGVGTRSRTSASTWNDPFRWHRKAEKAGTRPFVFCASLADIFDNQVPEEWRHDAFDVMRRTPRLVYLLLTKRPQNIVRMTEGAGGLPPNAALGTTVEDQARVNNLQHIESARQDLRPLFTFGSFEPLLERVTIPIGLMPDWVITGGASDQGSWRAPHSEPDWFRHLRNQAVRRGAAYHHKQNGAWASGEWAFDLDDHLHFHPDDDAVPVKGLNLAGADARMIWSEDDRAPEGRGFLHVGAKHSGRLLDGVLHDARPEVLT